jgi:hypothetical protein
VENVAEVAAATGVGREGGRGQNLRSGGIPGGVIGELAGATGAVHNIQNRGGSVSNERPNNPATQGAIEHHSGVPSIARHPRYQEYRQATVGNYNPQTGEGLAQRGDFQRWLDAQEKPKTA